MIYDFIVVGSGPTGAQAAQTLVEAGGAVAMLDAGKEDNEYKTLVPDKNFLNIREEEDQQHTYFLGKNFEGIPWGKVKVGSQLTPPRKYITEETDKWIPLVSDTFTPMESLGYGGLGSAWGTGCHVFSRYDLDEIGLDFSRIHEAYNVIAKRIIISGEKDDANPYCLGEITHFQEAIAAEGYAKRLLEKYQRKKTSLNGHGFYLGRAALAVATKETEGRKKTSYGDMEFWSDSEKSAYRPWITVDELKKETNFSYHSGLLVTRFEENPDGAVVFAKRMDTNEEISFSCRKLVLASGVLGTARIVLRSKDNSREQLPVISNSYCYLPCIQFNMLGKPIQKFRTSFAQLGLFYDEHGDNVETGMGALFSYRSLLLFKLIKEVPLDFADARILMQFLHSSMVIAGIHHPERSSPDKYIQLVKDESFPVGDKLLAHYQLSEKEKEFISGREKKYRWALKQLGCMPIKSVYPGHGASIHYAGTLPISKEQKEFSLSPEGRLWGTKNIFVADGSGFRYLPAKGLTLTLMANAHCVAENASKTNG